MTTDVQVRDAFITLDGLRFHYREWGSPTAPPLVLLHAFLQHARTWDTVARAFAADFRVLALDMRGFGESGHTNDYHEQRYVGDVAAFVTTLGLNRCALVGFSLGAMTACGYAAAHPQRVERLVLFECFTEGTESGDAPYLQEMRAHMTTFRSLPDPVASPAAAAAVFRPLAPRAAEDELLHWMEGGLARRPDGRWSWRYDPQFRTPGPPWRLGPPMEVLRARLAQVSCPLLLPVGAESWMVEPTADYATANPRAQVVPVPRAGHWVPLDNPSGFLEVVGEFLTRA